jgi:hypothetical protein
LIRSADALEQPAIRRLDPNYTLRATAYTASTSFGAAPDTLVTLF